jgi:hypothetical protein
MRYPGKIHFDRELTYSQSCKLTSILKDKGLMIAVDGRGIHWDGSNTQNIEQVLLEAMEHLTMHKIRCVGILHVIEDKEKKHDIVIIKNRVKLFRDGKIENIQK